MSELTQARADKFAAECKIYLEALEREGFSREESLELIRAVIEK